MQILERARRSRAEREERLLAEGYPAYTTTPGWLGYSDEKLEAGIPINSVRGIEAGVCCAHRAIVAWRP